MYGTHSWGVDGAKEFVEAAQMAVGIVRYRNHRAFGA